MARAMWKGVIRIADMAVPVKLYAAAEDRKVRFRLLHEPDGVPVQQRMVNPDTGDVVEADAVRRGFEVEKDRFVILRPEELDELEPEPSRDIQVSRFVPTGTIGHAWYHRPYYLAPDGHEKAYTALAAALSRQGREGVVRWVMRKKAHLGALHARDGHLTLMTLRHAEEVIPSRELDPPQGRELSERERAMAQQFVEALTGELDLAAYRDRYRDRVKELVELKRRGEPIPIPEIEEAAEAPGDDLSELLERSLAEVK